MKTVGMCFAPNNFFGISLVGWKLVSCAMTLKADPIDAIAPGAEAKLFVKAFDKGDKETYVNVLTSIQSLQAGKIINIDEKTRITSGISVGTATIELRDPDTDAKGVVVIEVKEPVITPPQATTTVEDFVTFSLTAPDGKPIHVPDTGLAFHSFQPQIADVD